MQSRQVVMSVIAAVTLASALAGALASALAGAGSTLAQHPHAGHATGAAPAAQPVDINSATRAELKALPGIGDAEADAIIKARPYLSKARLAADNILPHHTYFALKGLIVARQPAPSPVKGKMAAKP